MIRRLRVSNRETELAIANRWGRPARGVATTAADSRMPARAPTTNAASLHQQRATRRRRPGCSISRGVESWSRFARCQQPSAHRGDGRVSAAAIRVACGGSLSSRSRPCAAPRARRPPHGGWPTRHRERRPPCVRRRGATPACSSPVAARHSLAASTSPSCTPDTPPGRAPSPCSAYDRTRSAAGASPGAEQRGIQPPQPLR